MKDIINFIKIPLIIVLIFVSLVQGVFLMVGPDYKQGEYTMTYKIYYPNNPKTYTIKNDWPMGISSYKGTNTVEKTLKTPFFKNMFRSVTVFRTSAPIEIVSYTYKDKNYVENRR